jgi:chromosomal replication initiation ATPase DnaA
MKGQPTQLTFDLASAPTMLPEDFVASPSNAIAQQMIEQWPAWPHHAVVLEGPPQSGKSHLAQVWRWRSGAIEISAAALSENDAMRMTDTGAMLVEDLHNGISDERALFHMLNTAREKKLTMLLTTRVPPPELAINLPDLASRLRAAPRVTIFAPDEPLLRAVLVKHFADRQLAVDPSVVTYLAVRIERSLAAAETIVAALDARSLAFHRKVTRALAAEVIAEFGYASSGPDLDLDT